MDLTTAERFFLQRRREGKTQAAAAKSYRVPVDRYVGWERGEPGPSAPRIRRVLPHERCVIERRRAGLRQFDVAQALGRSREWVQKMEAGHVPCRELEEYWRG